MLRTIAAVLLAAPLAVFAATNALTPTDEIAPSVRLTGDEVILPIVMVKEFPFIEGEVNGVKGKFMFDTGADAAVIINHHRILLKEGTEIGHAKFGSGQTYAVQLNKTIESLKFAQLSFADVHTVESQDATQLEHITPDFVGWIGYQFFRGYAIKLDYQKEKVTFYKDGPAAETHFLHGETVVAVIPFEERKLARIPVVYVTLGSTIFDGSFDTGQYGSIWADEATRAQLASEGVLTKLTTNTPDDDERVDLKGIDVGGGAAKLTLRFDVSSTPSAADRAIGMSPENNITFAYNLLSQYKTVWDYANHKIYLLAYDAK